MKHYIEIDEAAGTPKYKQVITSIKKGIVDKQLKLGDKIHSINHLSKTYNLSRDTVKKAYNSLKSQKIINSVEGKGFYIIKTDLAIRSKVLFLCSELGEYEREVFVSLVEATKEFNTNVMLKLFHFDVGILEKVLHQRNSQFDKIVLIPQFKNKDGKVVNGDDEILQISKENHIKKLIILDKNVNDILPTAISVSHNYKEGFCEVLSAIFDRNKTYKKVVLVSPFQSSFPHKFQVTLGLKKSCKKKNLDFASLRKISDRSPIQTDSLYFTLDEYSTIQLLRKIKSENLILGKEVGLVSMDDAPYKDLLGISVIDRNFSKVGSTVAKMIIEEERQAVKIGFSLVDRSSA